MRKRGAVKYWAPFKNRRPPSYYFLLASLKLDVSSIPTFPGWFFFLSFFLSLLTITFLFPAVFDIQHRSGSGLIRLAQRQLIRSSYYYLPTSETTTAEHKSKKSDSFPRYLISCFFFFCIRWTCIVSAVPFIPPFFFFFLLSSLKEGAGRYQGELSLTSFFLSVFREHSFQEDCGCLYFYPYLYFYSVTFFPVPPPLPLALTNRPDSELHNTSISSPAHSLGDLAPCDRNRVELCC